MHNVVDPGSVGLLLLIAEREWDDEALSQPSAALYGILAE